MGKNKELRKIEDEKALNVQLRSLGIASIFLFGGIIFRQFHETVFVVLKFICFGGIAGILIFLKIYNGRRNKQ
jgi:hypothetical protein